MNHLFLSKTAVALAATFQTSVDTQESPKPEEAGTDALLFKDDPEFWFEITRLFGAAGYGGALFGEVIAIAKRIKSGDYDSWQDSHCDFADRLGSLWATWV